MAKHTQRTSQPSTPEAPPTIEEGDNVYLGSGDVHWKVARLTEAARQHPDQPFVRLESGMTGRRRPACLAELRLHSKGASDG